MALSLLRDQGFMSSWLLALDFLRDLRIFGLGGCSSCPWGAVALICCLACCCGALCGAVVTALALSRHLRLLLHQLLRFAAAATGPSFGGNFLGPRDRLAEYRQH